MGSGVGVLRRKLRVPVVNAESCGHLTRFLWERCDALARTTHCRKDASIAGLFEQGRRGMQPLPRIGFDAVDRQ